MRNIIKRGVLEIDHVFNFDIHRPKHDEQIYCSSTIFAGTALMSLLKKNTW